MSPPKQVLVIAYAFPPVGGAGVQRTLKFVKYLPEFGWNPIVLTASNPSVPVRDLDLLGEVPSNMQVLRAMTFEPPYAAKRLLVRDASGGNKTSGKKSSGRFLRNTLRSMLGKFLQPDPQVLWNTMAFRTACRAIQTTRIDAIYISGPPFSSFVLGGKLKKKFGLPLILDFRDEWSLSARYLENRNPTNGATRQDSGLFEQSLFEQSLLHADAVIATTQASANELRQCCAKAGSRAMVRTIYNGFDPSDLEGQASSIPASAKFRLVYSGTLWRLTDATPLVEAIQSMMQQNPELKTLFEWIVIGRRTEEQDAILERLLEQNVQVDRREYMPHREALAWSRSADAVSLLLADQEGAERVVPGKLFECLAIQRPILAIAPAGETFDLLRKHGSEPPFLPSQSAEIAQWLASHIQTKCKQKESIDSNVNSMSDSTNSNPRQSREQLDQLHWCSRRSLTQELALFFDELKASKH